MPRPLRRSLTNSPTSLIAGASLIGQLFSLVAIPLVSRQYSPEAVGVFSTCLAISTIVASVITLRIDRALTLPDSEKDAAVFAVGGVFASAAIIVLGSAIYIVTTLVLANDFIALWWVIPPLAAAIAWGTLLLQFGIRQRQYRTVAWRNFLQPAVTGVLQVSLGLFIATATSLSFSAIAGKLCGLAAPLKAVLRELGPFRHIGFSVQFPRLVYRYRRFLTLGTVAGLMNTASLQIALPLVVIVYGSSEAGQFAMSQLVLSAPLVLVGNAVGQVFLGDFSNDVRNRRGRASIIFSSTSRWLFIGGITVGIIVFLLSPKLFPLILGNTWELSGLLGVALSPLLASRFISAPLAQTLIVLEKQGTQLILDSVRLAGIFASFALSFYLGLDIVATIFIYSCWCTVCYVAQWLLCRKALDFGLQYPK